MNIFDYTTYTLERALDYASIKNDTISQNIANVDTPNYRAKDVAFKDVLQQSIKAYKTHPKHLSFSGEDRQIQVFQKRNTNYNHNRNNVDIDKEMASLSKNQLYYQSLVDRLNGKFNDIETVLRGGS